MSLHGITHPVHIACKQPTLASLVSVYNFQQKLVRDMSISKALLYEVPLPLLSEKFTIVCEVLNKIPAPVVLHKRGKCPIGSIRTTT